MIQEFSGCVGERYATRLTYKQSNPDFSFQLWDATADRRFSNHEFGGGSSDATFVCGTSRRYRHTTFDVLASRILTLSEPTSVAGCGSHQSEGHSGGQTKDRAMISAQAEDQRDQGGTK
jgi:hypothetical protein